MNLQMWDLKLYERDQKNYEAGYKDGYIIGVVKALNDAKAAGLEDYIPNIIKNILKRGLLTDEEICENTGCTQELIDSVRAFEAVHNS